VRKKSKVNKIIKIKRFLISSRAPYALKVLINSLFAKNSTVFAILAESSTSCKISQMVLSSFNACKTSAIPIYDKAL